MNKKTIFLTVLGMVLGLSACNNSGVSQADYDALLKEKEALVSEVKSLRDSIKLLSFPADQRLAKIKKLVSEQSYQQALQGISDLTKTFPSSAEATTAKDMIPQINSLIEKKKAEEERIKALGFKAVKQSLTATIDYNKIELSNISIGNTFTHDSYDDRYFYNTADRDNKYISVAMKVTSSSKEPKLPQLAVYTVSGDKMNLVETFRTEFARWNDYGSYLGNYHDNGNDFAKTSSVRFKLGAEVSQEILKKPYAIVMMNANVLTREYDKWENPPVSYVGSGSYPSILSLENFTAGNYTLVKLANL